jgi:hypothetical protein
MIDIASRSSRYITQQTVECNFIKSLFCKRPVESRRPLKQETAVCGGGGEGLQLLLFPSVHFLFRRQNIDPRDSKYSLCCTHRQAAGWRQHSTGYDVISRADVSANGSSRRNVAEEQSYVDERSRLSAISSPAAAATAAAADDDEPRQSAVATAGRTRRRQLRTVAECIRRRRRQSVATTTVATQRRRLESPGGTGASVATTGSRRLRRLLQH